jgi:MerR family transcriptional regulator, light-induced transcriptional regulator
MASGEDLPVLRIGELSRRLGVSDHILRAWESRYGLLQPVRSAGGFRLYSEADARRIRQMQAHLARGLSAAEAARSVLREDSEPGADQDPASSASGPRATASELCEALRTALDAFDEPTAQAVLDRLVSDLSLTTVLRDAVLPFLADLGQRWEQGTATVAQEHFASNVIRGRLAGLARGWGNGQGPRAVLACPPGEHHDLALMAFGIVLNRTGWRIDYLGINTPIEELTGTVDARVPDLVVLAATLSETLGPLTAQLIALAQRAPLALAGPGVTPRLAAAVQARLLAGDPVTAAENVGWPR